MAAAPSRPKTEYGRNTVRLHAAVATGHISPGESALLLEEGLRAGAKMILTHPDSGKTRMPLEQQAALAGKGVIVEKLWDNVQHGYTTAEAICASIRAIGPEHVILGTDFGQVTNPHPVQGMHDFIGALIRCGFTDAEIRRMACENPAAVLNLSRG